MSITPRPPLPSFLPESAPFTPQQRAWLDGLFAGVFGLEGGVTPLSKQDVAKLLPGLIDAPDEAPEEIDDGAPWHDPATPLPERMKLAEGRPLPRRMMAAMAQQDCSQCGYNCKDYADALFSKKEKRLNLCVPGGKETARMLKQLYQELEIGAPKTDAAPEEASTRAARPRPAARATIRSPPRSSRATASTRKARKRKPGISNSILPNAASITRLAIPSACSRPTIPAWSTPCSRRSRRRRIFPSAGARCVRC